MDSDEVIVCSEKNITCEIDRNFDSTSLQNIKIQHEQILNLLNSKKNSTSYTVP